MANQNPEQIARDNIDSQLIEAGWLVQSRDEVDLNAGPGVAVREYQTDIGRADYVLFVDCKPVGVIEAKREEDGERLTTVEYQSSGYAKARLKYNLNKEPSGPPANSVNQQHYRATFVFSTLTRPSGDASPSGCSRYWLIWPGFP